MIDFFEKMAGSWQGTTTLKEVVKVEVFPENMSPPFLKIQINDLVVEIKTISWISERTFLSSSDFSYEVTYIDENELKLTKKSIETSKPIWFVLLNRNS